MESINKQKRVNAKTQKKEEEKPQKVTKEQVNISQKKQKQSDEKKLQQQQQLFDIILKLIQEYQQRNQQITRKQLRQSLQSLNFEKKDIEKQIQMIQKSDRVYFEQVDKDICYSLRDNADELKRQNIQEHLDLITQNIKRCRDQGDNMWNQVEQGMREDHFLKMMKQQKMPYLLIKQNLKLLKKQKKIIRQKDGDVFLLKEYLNENEQKMKLFIEQQLEDQIFVQRQLRKLTSIQFIQSNQNRKQSNNRIYKKILGEIPVIVRSIFSDNKIGGKKYIFLKENQFFFEQEYVKSFEQIYQKMVAQIKQNESEFNFQVFCEENKFEFTPEDLVKYYNYNNPNAIQLKNLKKTKQSQSKKTLTEDEMNMMVNKIKQFGSLEQDQIFQRLKGSKQMMKMNNIIQKLI